ncbi:hypothetical protein DBR06_SOUSAS2810182 [Sousa chinensis]|uniref:Uncharacterized protein n=1 Tax=Sousa chinensis TaxID=103600 RepID=A0A484GIK5_SOUCH|nr:hypothetical protein DBR06_SOUSAS2810182 [Sousa chinensis]
MLSVEMSGLPCHHGFFQKARKGLKMDREMSKGLAELGIFEHQKE